MSFTKYIPTTRVNGEKVVMKSNQFARFVSRRTGVSNEALSTAIRLISEGIVQVLAEGFDVQFNGLGTFETRELKPRLRYNRVKGERYMSEPSVIVHFRKAASLTDNVRKLAIQRLEQVLEQPTTKPVGGK